MILTLPNLAEDTLAPFMNHDGIIVEEIDQKEVPLKVSNVLMNPERMRYLVQEK